MGSRRWRPRSPGLARPPGRPPRRGAVTDLDPTWLTASGGRQNLRVRRHDVGLDPPWDGTFDLVLVLVHVRQRNWALSLARADVRRSPQRSRSCGIPPRVRRGFLFLLPWTCAAMHLGAQL